MKQFLAISLLLLVFLGSCKKDTLRGNESYTTDTVTVWRFTAMTLNSSVPLSIVKDTQYAFIVKGHGDLVGAFDYTVNNDTLTLQYNSQYSNINNNDITLELHTPYLYSVTNNTDRAILVNSGFYGDNFYGLTTGNGSISVDSCNYTAIHSFVNGSGTISTQTSHSDTAYAVLNGIGSINTYAKNYFYGRISGNGNVYYYGQPAVTDLQVLSGIGNFIAR
ncbi:GIN domain-containing protein [Chitinophagaceae bacterium MMS25-I14]